ncbi:MAG: site-specific DNA-methyltransferase [Acidobacteria bacterium]|nr:site-specific DNA-methyltransferase [Acidobacteriota bacterium]MCW5970377.1 site-specific DNA-methyltransferase [Blastocatellales bacterium]
MATKPEIAAGYYPGAEAVIVEGDCRDALAALPSGLAKLIITSPPYNIGKSYETAARLDDYLVSFLPVIDELVRVLSPDGSLCWQVGNYVADAQVFPLDIFFYPLLRSRGLRLRNRIVWHFAHGMHEKRRFSGRYEVLLWFTRGDRYTFHLDDVRVPSKYPGKTHFRGARRGLPSGHPLGKNPGDFWNAMERDWASGVWEIPNVKAKHPEKTIHPCQFPIELVERCVLALTDENDWVLDPFAGAGSSLVAALAHGRRALGCEKEVEYARLARERIEDLYAGRLAYRPLGRPVHAPTGREKASRAPTLFDVEP